MQLSRSQTAAHQPSPHAKQPLAVDSTDIGVNNMPAPYTGGCQCGSVRYVLTTEPIRLAACHCKECQRQSGSAFGMSMPVTKQPDSDRPDEAIYAYRRQWQRSYRCVLS